MPITIPENAMIWAALYIIVAVAFVPFCCRTTIEGREQEHGRAGAAELAACLFGGVCLACVWPLLALVWLVDRGR
jgi:hypothetical protein